MKLTKFILIFLLVLGYHARSPGQSIKFFKPQEKSNKNSSRVIDPKWTVEFWDNLRLIPVKFVECKEMGRKEYVLIAQFVSQTMVQQINFKLSPKAFFFKRDGDWEREIDSKDFIKNIKKELWLLSYTPGPENLIYEAHQFKSWAELDASFFSDHSEATKSNESLVYWSKIRLKPVYFYDLEGDKAHWLFAAPTDAPPDLVKDNETIRLEHGVTTTKKIKDIAGQSYLFLQNGTFIIDKKCTFSTAEMRTPRKIAKINVVPGSTTKIKVQPLLREDFEKRVVQSFWFCFYDNSTKILLRISEIPYVKD